MQQVVTVLGGPSCARQQEVSSVGYGVLLGSAPHLENQLVSLLSVAWFWWDRHPGGGEQGGPVR